AYPGGLLEHSVNMMKIANAIVPFLPMLNRDLLLTGTFLHDVGKVEELNFKNEMSYSDHGQMLGHPFLGVEILHDKIREAAKLANQPFDPEIAMMLKHMLISHHGNYENGSSKLPMCVEALALHYIDSLDAKLAEFQKYIFEDPNADGNWTNYIAAIDRKLYKGKQDK
ncbi:MAG: HD domain-containing protein, partial [Thermoguttaceae bacterium]